MLLFFTLLTGPGNETQFDLGPGIGTGGGGKFKMRRGHIEEIPVVLEG